MQIIHCGHIFRESNIRRHFRRNTRCPLCRFDIRDSDEILVQSSDEDSNTSTDNSNSRNNEPNESTSNNRENEDSNVENVESSTQTQDENPLSDLNDLLNDETFNRDIETAAQGLLDSLTGDLENQYPNDLVLNYSIEFQPIFGRTNISNTTSSQTTTRENNDENTENSNAQNNNSQNTSEENNN